MHAKPIYEETAGVHSVSLKWIQMHDRRTTHRAPAGILKLFVILFSLIYPRRNARDFCGIPLYAGRMLLTYGARYAII